MTLKSRSVFFTALISISIQNYAQNMPILVELAKEQKWNELASLLEDGLNPNVIYGDGTTALHWASYHNSEHAIQSLLTVNADVNATTSGREATVAAIRKRKLERSRHAPGSRSGSKDPTFIW